MILRFNWFLVSPPLPGKEQEQLEKSIASITGDPQPDVPSDANESDIGNFVQAATEPRRTVILQEETESAVLEEASVENPSIILNPKSLEVSVQGPVQDSVAGGPGEQSAIAPTDSICAEPEVQEEKQSEQLLNLQPEPPSEELPAELLDTEHQTEEQVFTVADLIEESNKKEQEVPSNVVNHKYPKLSWPQAVL